MLSSAKCCPIILWLNEASGEQQGVRGGGAFRKMHLFNSAMRSKDHLLCLGCPAIKKQVHVWGAQIKTMDLQGVKKPSTFTTTVL